MNHVAEFDAAFARCPLIAILRGVKPDEVEAIGDELVAAGFTLIEVPMNSPDPLDSVSRLAKRFAGRAVIGAGTVLRVEQVQAVAEAGGTMIISPNANLDVIRASAAAGLVSLPGILTPSEAFAALDAGATALKLFPAEAASPTVLKAMRAVLTEARILPVGGVSPDTMAPWIAAGAPGFGLGSALYKVGMSAEQVGANARAFIAALG
ncbi:2-dehydro-3-deoxy-6-phosphogalactonate aldolase [Sphingomonas sp. ABOLD]|uniref:2-dehydro-3-deoxyphosphogalactonate aldolase n=1 Tax=Sphingomonas trueperi TaxID=53317 RepID=A0A7X5Y0G4_9SPHN|nr:MULTISPECIES: 2-dehydro-3-deoxy-6-phosphogalactonate aldolase [Sphingomonas]NJB98335.1 2-dehydro-3-deoxyphosphogalactonate aldolase [Sphingomonas trueperi]RSV44752.1 2-dehydro-3-deoxy-6-phosphogalactonate aldolase [Sphingomonas sp. ABOLD]RSV45437.1 2-dehydro-3-deoxy-6-phosphogalactonate aldolase [Sphingomonas sp. ABOLE]